MTREQMMKDQADRSAELGKTIEQLTELRDRAMADGNREVAEDAITAAHALMVERRRLYGREGIE